MRYILPFLLLAGCTSNQSKDQNTSARSPYAAEKELTIFEDKVRGVVCYSRYTNTLSCVKLKN